MHVIRFLSRLAYNIIIYNGFGMRFYTNSNDIFNMCEYDFGEGSKSSISL